MIREILLFFVLSASISATGGFAFAKAKKCEAGFSLSLDKSVILEKLCYNSFYIIWDLF